MAAMTWMCDCGSVNDTASAQCSVCGTTRPTQMFSAPMPTGPHVQVGLQEEPSTTSQTEVTCTGCGRKSPADTEKCLRCGEVLPPAGAGAAAAADRSCPRLVLPNRTSVNIPTGETVVLGRHSSDPVVAAALELHDQVSRKHAELRVDGQTATVTDLGSTNGTFVNGRAVADKATVPLAGGVTIRFGKELEIVLLPGDML